MSTRFIMHITYNKSTRFLPTMGNAIINKAPSKVLDIDVTAVQRIHRELLSGKARLRLLVAIRILTGKRSIKTNVSIQHISSASLGVLAKIQPKNFKSNITSTIINHLIKSIKRAKSVLSEGKTFCS